MAALYCNNCSATVGDCGHVAGGWTGKVKITGTCATCGKPYEAACSGGCLPMDAGLIGGPPYAGEAFD